MLWADSDADPDFYFDLDPNHTFPYDADPYPTFHFDADPDPPGFQGESPRGSGSVINFTESQWFITFYKTLITV